MSRPPVTGPYSLAQTGINSYRDLDNYLLVQSNLAIAWEAHTANLIAWRNGGKIFISDIPEVDEQIRLRLGIWKAPA